MPRKLFLLLGLIAATSAIALACSDSDDPTATPAASDMEHAHTDNVGLLAALSTVGDADLHHVENTLIGDEPEIDPTWIAPILNARTATAIVTWPEELEDASQDFLDDSMPLLMALQNDDLDAAVAAAPAAHASWHLLRDPGFAYLAEVAGTGSMGDGDHAHGADDADHENGDHGDDDSHDDMEMDDDADGDDSSSSGS